MPCGFALTHLHAHHTLLFSLPDEGVKDTTTLTPCPLDRKAEEDEDITGQDKAGSDREDEGRGKYTLALPSISTDDFEVVCNTVQNTLRTHMYVICACIVRVCVCVSLCVCVFVCVYVCVCVFCACMCVYVCHVYERTLV